MGQGLELMEFLLKRKQRKMTILDSQINEIKHSIESFKDTPDFIRLSVELKDKMSKWDFEVQNKKKKKFIRDSDDFNGGEQRLRQEAEQPRTPRPHQPDWAVSPSPVSVMELPSPVSEREQPSPVSELDQPSPGLDVEEEEVVEIRTPQSDDLVVEGQAAEPFSTDSAQRLIGQIMAWNGNIDLMENNIHAMQQQLDTMRQEMKNMIDVLGRI
ncbi:uncharacterized protein LOC143961999 [Lithobates pipiens]